MTVIAGDIEGVAIKGPPAHKGWIRIGAYTRCDQAKGQKQNR
jgi:hypothetical protein